MSTHISIFVVLLLVGLGCGGDSGDKPDASDGTSNDGSGGRSAAGNGTGGSGGSGGVSGNGSGGSGGSGGASGNGSGGSGGSGGVSGKGSGGSVGSGGTSGSGSGGSAGSGGAFSADCVYKFGNPNNCRVCADDATCDAPKYTDNGDGTVTSSCCGLVWQQEVDTATGQGNGFTWKQANTYCADLSLAGGGWRMPTVEELVSLVVRDQSPISPSIDRAAFPNTIEDAFWTSSPDADSTGDMWIVVFYGGNTNIANTDSDVLIRIRCVR